MVARLAGVTRRSNDFAADERPFGVGAPRLVLGVGVADALEFFDVSSRNFFSLTLDCFNVNFPALGSLAVSSNRKGVDAISPHVISGLASTPGVKFGVCTRSYCFVCGVLPPFPSRLGAFGGTNLVFFATVSFGSPTTIC